MACLGIDLSALRTARAIAEDVFARVQSDSLYARPIRERHRIIFYIGHLEAFDWNLFSPDSGAPALAPDLDQLFAFGIDPKPGELPSDTQEDWPALDRTYEYRDRIQAFVDQHWNSFPEQLRHVSMEHRLMHAETLAYMLHNLPPERLVPAEKREPAETNGAVAGEVVEVPKGTAVLGRCRGEGFGWDNEFSQEHVPVEAFRIDRWKVTNGDYLAFVKSGAAAPHYWENRNGKWFLRRMFDEVALPLDWPVWVTHDQATAYAHWRDAELPSEAQWHRAAQGSPDEGNFDARRWDPEPVTACPGSASAFGVEGLLGNGWEWTSSLFRPFTGFQPFSFYPGYSANFFDDDHFVLKGASPRTDAVFLRRSFRNWFRRDYPYVFASFRCIHNSH